MAKLPLVRRRKSAKISGAEECLNTQTAPDRNGQTLAEGAHRVTAIPHSNPTPPVRTGNTIDPGPALTLRHLTDLMNSLPAPQTRRCGFWLTPHIGAGNMAILDTTALATDAETYRGSDAWPKDMLLVLIDGRTLAELKTLTGLPKHEFGFIGESELAAWVIDGQCAKQLGLNVKLRWRIPVPANTEAVK